MSAILKAFKKLCIFLFCRDNFTKNKFNKIHANNSWNSEESASGLGSELKNTTVIRSELPKLFKKLKVKIFLDAPCGDFNWMKKVNLSGIKYIGGDIVEALIANNTPKYANKNKQFKLLDITKDNLPKANLMLCRDCLVHLSYKDIITFW